MKVFIILGLIAVSLLVISPAKSKSLGTTHPLPIHNQSIVKKTAFEILKTKCNICHIKQNRKKIFSLENMNVFASKIEEQVFVKKRMPRGKKIQLNEEEYAQLYIWIKSSKQ